jgi:hypothetical protein
VSLYFSSIRHVTIDQKRPWFSTNWKMHSCNSASGTLILKTQVDKYSPGSETRRAVTNGKVIPWGIDGLKAFCNIQVIVAKR